MNTLAAHTSATIFVPPAAVSGDAVAVPGDAVVSGAAAAPNIFRMDGFLDYLNSILEFGKANPVTLALCGANRIPMVVEHGGISDVSLAQLVKICPETAPFLVAMAMKLGLKPDTYDGWILCVTDPESFELSEEVRVEAWAILKENPKFDPEALKLSMEIMIANVKDQEAMWLLEQKQEEDDDEDDDDADDDRNDDEDEPTDCRNWLATGYCKWDKDCRFLHRPEAAPKAAALKAAAPKAAAPKAAAPKAAAPKAAAPKVAAAKATAAAAPAATEVCLSSIAGEDCGRANCRDCRP